MLYDHDNDPMEWRNLAGDPDFADVTADLARALPEHEGEDAPKEN